MKVCFFSGDISRSGGTERVCALIANELVKKNYSINILSLEQKKEKTFFNLNDDIRINFLFNQSEKRILKHSKTILRLHKYILQNKIDVLINVDTILDIYSTPAVLFTKTKNISWEHFNFYENLGSKYRDWGRKLASRFSDTIVTITREDQEYFLENLTPRCPVQQIYNPIMMTDEKNKAKSNNKIILSAGRLTYQKGFDLLIDVAKLVFEVNPDWKWIILGEGEDRKILEDKIQIYNLEKNVILKGNVTNIENYYNNSNLFVLTSRYEGFGLVLTEAKAYGLPCISFKCKAGPSEIIADGINGYLIDCFDIKKMADKINILIADEKQRKEFSSNSLVDTEKFETNNVVKKWIAVLENLGGVNNEI